MPGPYEAEYKAGDSVRIASQDVLLRFMREWRYHHPLHEEQVGYAGTISRVMDVGFYHGGDPLYRLEDVPGYWHEEHLQLIAV